MTVNNDPTWCLSEAQTLKAPLVADDDVSTFDKQDNLVSMSHSTVDLRHNQWSMAINENIILEINDYIQRAAFTGMPATVHSNNLCKLLTQHYYIESMTRRPLLFRRNRTKF